MTHTYAVLEISRAAYDEIHAKLDAAGYQHAFEVARGHDVIDMHGIGLAVEALDETRCDLCGRPRNKHHGRMGIHDFAPRRVTRP